MILLYTPCSYFLKKEKYLSTSCSLSILFLVLHLTPFAFIPAVSECLSHWIPYGNHGSFYPSIKGQAEQLQAQWEIAAFLFCACWELSAGARCRAVTGTSGLPLEWVKTGCCGNSWCTFFLMVKYLINANR